MAVSGEPTVTELLTLGEELARRRSEPLSGVHLLAALGATKGPARDLLDEKGAGFRRVLDCWETLLDRGSPENLQVLLRSTQQVARRHGARTGTASHLLLALLGDVSGAARRVLGEMQIDPGDLRHLAMQVAQGLPTRRRESGEVPLAIPVRLPAAPRGTAVPVMPTEPVSGPRRGRIGVTAPLGQGEAVPLIPVGRPAAPSRSGGVVAPLQARRLASAAAHPFAGDFAGGEGKSGAGDRADDGDDGAGLFTLPRKTFPILTQVGRNLTLAAYQGRHDRVVGRDEEIEHALDVLAKRHGNNPCLVGPAGVGKTSVARGVAARLADPQGVSDWRAGEGRIVVEIPIAELVAGTGVRGALAGRLAALKKEVLAASGRVVLFFDEIHQLFAGEAAEEIASDLKLSLARGELPCIGATSPEEFRRVFETDAGLSRRFSAVEIEEPSREEAFLVLSGVAERLAAHHRVAYEEDALAMAIAWSIRYLPGRALPDKAVSLIDLAGARSRRRGRATVDAEAVAEVVASQASMPIERLLQSDAERMLGLEEMLQERVIGHEAHLGRIARILRRNAAGLGGHRPIGTFLLLGPTGVGKTETAKAIAEVLFHSASAMTRIDMAEMSEAHAVARLVGAPPGYVGHDAGGQLTEAVRRRPYQVLLLDEIEKAHPEVLMAFLAVFDEGRMTDSRGRLVDFTNTVILLTSNLGGQALSDKKKRVGFQAEAEDDDLRQADAVRQAARDALPPELYNRLDEVLAFSPLSRSAVFRIGRKMLKALADELELGRGVLLDVSDSAVGHLLDAGGYDPKLGARPLRRTIARQIEAPLAEALLSGQLSAGDIWHVTVEGSELCCQPRRGLKKAQ